MFVDERPNIFQFLLVRLRESKILGIKSAVLISIPSGAIKRVNENFVLQQVFLFQFLLVRLRDDYRLDRLPRLDNFNSFWCD